MRTVPLVLITFVVLSLAPTAARAGANGSWCANYGTGLGGAINCSYTSFQQCRAVWVLHAHSRPRNGLRERRDLERDADESRSPLPRRAIDPFQQDESVGRMHMRGATGCAIYYRLSDRLEPTKGNGWCSNAPKRS